MLHGALAVLVVGVIAALFELGRIPTSITNNVFVVFIGVASITLILILTRDP